MRIVLPLLVFTLVSCSAGPSITRTAKGTYHASSGFSFAAKMEIAEGTLKTREGDEITFKGMKQKSDGVPQAAIFGIVASQIANASSALEAAKSKDAASVSKATISGEVQKTSLTEATKQAAIAGEVTKATTIPK